MTLLIKTYPGMGRGVYTSEAISKGSIVEVSPVIPLSANDWKHVKNTLLETYVYAWGIACRSNALALGYGGLFNHSDDPNLIFFLDLENLSITFQTKRSIAVSEQLTIDYMWSKKDRKKYLMQTEKVPLVDI